MIKLGDLVAREYEGKDCTRFSYRIKDDEGFKVLEATFERVMQVDRYWTMRIVVGPSEHRESQIYSVGIVVPRSTTPLEHIAYQCLRIFINELREEIQTKSSIDFQLGSLLGSDGEGLK